MVRSLIRKIIVNSWFLALFPALIIFYILPKPGLSHRLNVENQGEGYSTLRFADIDSDGVTEAFKSAKGFPYYHILVMDNDQNIHDQWNFKDTMYIDQSDYFFGNYDNDKYSEIYAFTYKDDSLFLNINEFFEKSGVKPERLFITKIGIV